MTIIYEAIRMENHESTFLLQQIKNGSREAFDKFYDTYFSFVFNIAFHIVKDQLEAEDISHDVFLEIFQKPEQYNPSKGSMRAWLAVKTKSRSIDRLRKKQPLLVNRLEVLITSNEPGADVQFLNELQNHILIAALNQIPEEQREAIVRSYFKEETHREIALHMQKPLGSVKSLIRYGLNNLRKQNSILNWMRPSGGEKKNEI